MRLFIKRNEQEFGPYPTATALNYLESGSLLPRDLARIDAPGTIWKPLATLLKEQGVANPVDADSYNPKKVFDDLKSFDLQLVFPWREVVSGQWLRNHRFLLFAGAGMLPILFVAIGLPVTLVYVAIAFYTSSVWALFFYYLFKTKEVQAKTAVICFFVTATVSVAALLLIQSIPPFSWLYAMADSSNFFTRFIGMFFGVGICEELCKAAVVIFLIRRPGRVMLPQTVVFYGMMSGLGFGICEGVMYQLTINAAQEGAVEYILNILRLTSLPFLHAVWAGISAYYLSFSVVAPKKRASLWLVAILIPAGFHGLYNTFGGGLLGVAIAILSVFFLMSYLANCEQLKLHLTKNSAANTTS